MRLRAEAELLRGLLLQRGGRERRRGILAALAPLDVGDREHRLSAACRSREDAVGLVRVGDLGLLPVDLVQLRGERLPVLLERGRHRPVLHRLERADLALALHDQPERDRLHAAGREPFLTVFQSSGLAL